MESECHRWWAKLLLSTIVVVCPLSAQVPIPSVNIDTPTQGSSISGTVTISGWALDNVNTNLGTALSSVAIQVDGTTVGSATMGISRPDVCQVYPSRPGCPNVGWAYSLNASALTSGTHTITAVAMDENVPSTSGSASVTVTVVGGGAPVAGVTNPQNEPWVDIDSPTAGSAVTGSITVTGWALDTIAGQGSAISSVQVFVDGAAAGTATYGSPRPDVCAGYPSGPGCPNVGYSFTLNTANYSAGQHTLTVTATDSSSPPMTNSSSAVFTVNSPVTSTGLGVYIDGPTNGAVINGSMSIDGWAIDVPGGMGIAQVQILVDGKLNGTASYAVNRTDVCDIYPGRPNCPYVGFTYQVPTAQLTLGTHTLTATATTFDSPQTSVSWTINFSVASTMTVTIESPTESSNTSGYTTVSGWALDNGPNGTPITQVQVSVDGAYNGTAYYGLGRTDVCSQHAGSAGCPNVGFFYYLNMNPFAPGGHTITVTATDSSSPPNTASANVNVSVPAPSN